MRLRLDAQVLIFFAPIYYTMGNLFEVNNQNTVWNLVPLNSFYATGLFLYHLKASEKPSRGILRDQ